MKEGLLEPDDAYRLARETLSSKPHTLPYKAVIVDEAQDMGFEAFRLLRRLSRCSKTSRILIVFLSSEMGIKESMASCRARTLRDQCSRPKP